MNIILSTALLSILAVQTAFAADKNGVCEAQGKSLSHMGVRLLKIW
ncbi:MAG: hypothetical protein H7333_04465 [Bdellovibrionales bacterium]|nr:hypothetical protein [Oligoflexia bacterium]